MNNYLRFIELIIKSSIPNTEVFEDESEEINTLFYNIITYGSPFDKQEFTRYMIQELNRSPELALVLARYRILWKTSDFIELTNHIYNSLNITATNYDFIDNIVITNYNVRPLLADLDSSFYFNMMGIINNPLPLQLILNTLSTFLDNMIETTRDVKYSNIYYDVQPGESVFVLFMHSYIIDAAIRKLIDQMFLYSYVDLIYEIVTNFVGSYIRQEYNLYQIIKQLEHYMISSKPSWFRELVDVISGYFDLPEETNEFRTILYIILNTMMDAFVELITHTSIDPNVAIMFINIRNALTYIK